MPTFEITSKKTGKTYEITGPTREGALAALKKKLAAEPDTSSDTPEMAARRRQGLNPEPPPFDPGVRGYDPETGNVLTDDQWKVRNIIRRNLGLDEKTIPIGRNDTDIIDKIGAFASGTVEGVPIIGPTLRKVAQAAGATWVAPFSDRTWSEDYDEMGRIIDRAQEDNPLETTVGNVTGAVAPMIALGGTTLGGTVLGTTGRTLGGRVVASGLSNAGINAADTAARGGSGEDVLTSAEIGGAIGGAVPVLGSLGSAAWKYGAEKFGPRIGSPEREAARRVTSAMEMDQPTALGATDEASAAINNQPLINIDRGGETTRALAKSAANQDPAAREAIETTARDRFETQGERAVSFIDRISLGAASRDALKQELKARAPLVNRPAYRKAYTEGRDLVKTPELERLMGSPAVVAAMKGAIQKGKDRAIKEGMGTFNPAVSITDDGRILFNKTKSGDGTVFPDLQFWDYTKRELDDMAKFAARQGRDGEADTLRGLALSLRSELDRIVPSYAQARAGAEAFFDAKDAVEAGENFVTQNVDLDEAARVLGKMPLKDRRAFAVGFASKLKDDISRIPDNQDVTRRMFGNLAIRNKIMLALGRKNYQEFEQFVKVEQTMNKLRGAMGNSTTARQLAEMGLAATAGGGTALSLTGDWKSGLGAAIVSGLTRRYYGAQNTEFTRQIAKILLSSDPDAIKRAATMAARNPAVAQAIEQIQTAIGSATRAIGTEESRPEHKPLEITVTKPATVGAH